PGRQEPFLVHALADVHRNAHDPGDAAGFVADRGECGVGEKVPAVLPQDRELSLPCLSREDPFADEVCRLAVLGPDQQVADVAPGPLPPATRTAPRPGGSNG